MNRLTCFFLLLLWFPIAVLAQETPPAVVQAAYAERFPEGQEPNWKTQKDGDFEVKFVHAERKTRAVFAATGAWKRTETRLKKKDLPSAVNAYLSEEVAGYGIKKGKRVERAGKATVLEVTTENEADHKRKFVFDAEGRFLKEKGKK